MISKINNQSTNFIGILHSNIYQSKSGFEISSELLIYIIIVIELPIFLNDSYIILFYYF
jgi:hypothetical protein